MRFSFPQKTHTYVFCASQLLQSLKSKGGSRSCNIFGRISCFLATQMSRKTKSWLSQKDLAMFFSLFSLTGLTWTPGPRICSKHTGEDWTLPGSCFDNVSPGTVLPEPFYISVWQRGQRLRENNGKFEEEPPHLSNKCDFYQHHLLLLRD